MNRTIRPLIILVLLLCATALPAHGDPASLAWWLLPEGSGDLPHEIEEDESGYWKEIWLRPGYGTEVQPSTVMEQGLGVRWIGMDPDKDGKPSRAVLVLADKKVVEFTGEKTVTGIINDAQVLWSGGIKEPLFEFRRRRRHRGHSTQVRFGKIPLPPLASRVKSLKPWSMENLNDLLQKLPDGTSKLATPLELSAVAHISDQNGSILNFRYADNCDFQDRQTIESVLAEEVEPKLTCWMEQNVEQGSRLLGALLQRPVIDCRVHAPMDSEDCAMASLPHVSSFFIKDPKIYVPLSRCTGELGQTLLHEIFHLAGFPEKAQLLDEAVQESESCRSFPATLNFENQGEGFLNDFQVQTRIFLFRKIRDEAVSQWGWTEGEASYLLGTICNKMGDKYCARNFFQKAAEGNLGGTIQLPEGSEVSWSSLAQYQFYDSISEDLNRMHELVHYLHRDPNGTLLRRDENGVYRLHEFFVARAALEDVQNNRGICNGDTDEHVMCDDLAQIVKTPWFRNP